MRTQRTMECRRSCNVGEVRILRLEPFGRSLDNLFIPTYTRIAPLVYLIAFVCGI